MEIWDACLKTVAALAVVVALLQYKRSKRLERARWLMDLFHRFYADQLYKPVYLAFEGLAPDDHKKIRAIVEGDGTDADTEWSLTLYLNFFELVLTLEKEGQLSESDIKVLFDWPIQRVANAPGMHEYLQRYGYEKLHAHLTKRKGS